mmetsp:Transcript_22043/g.32997  ORF Transcript_22043/g.32997 Transcript_22043/m.32997 type:complete len:282 (-) Transcript_22043:79-924(-)
MKKKKSKSKSSNDKMKSQYDKDHSSIRLANSYEGYEIIQKSNLDSFTSIPNIKLSSTLQELLPDNKNDVSDSTDVRVQCCTSPLEPYLYRQCLSLFQRNMDKLYEHSNWGLDLKMKENELSHPNARFLIVTTSSDDQDGEQGEVGSDIVLAFTHFRFECSIDECNENNYVYNNSFSFADDHESVLYVYEIQIDPKIQRQNVGKRLMTLMQIIAMRMNMDKVMLTVFKFNNGAMNFYKNKLGYQLDQSSPGYFDETDQVYDDEGEKEADYEILSKIVQSSKR